MTATDLPADRTDEARVDERLAAAARRLAGTEYDRVRAGDPPGGKAAEMVERAVAWAGTVYALADEDEFERRADAARTLVDRARRDARVAAIRGADRDALLDGVDARADDLLERGPPVRAVLDDVGAVEPHLDRFDRGDERDGNDADRTPR